MNYTCTSQRGGKKNQLPGLLNCFRERKYKGTLVKGRRIKEHFSLCFFPGQKETSLWRRPLSKGMVEAVHVAAESRGAALRVGEPQHLLIGQRSGGQG